MKKILLSAVFALCYWSVFSQGSISGTITDAKTKEAIIGANVVIQGTTTGAQTDVDGKFLIPNLTAGSYTLQISFITYKTHIIPDVLVEDGKRINVDVPLSEEVSELKEVVVSGTRQTNTDYELVRSIKEAKVIVVGITSEQIAKTLDRDAAQVLKRVPGINIKDEQFVVIRGLSERYNPVMLHNAYAPSVENDIRSFSFSTIPSSQLDKIEVYKTASADLPGDFAGGVVKIFTKSIPDQNGVVVDYSTQYRAGTTFHDFYYQERNPGHFTGYNTGYYNLPSSFPSNAQNLSGSDLANAGQSLKNLWKPVKGTALPDQRLTVTFNKKFSIGKVQAGNITALSYSNSYQAYSINRGDYTEQVGSFDINYLYKDRQYNQLIRTGLLHNWAFKFNSDHKIEFKNLFNVGSNDQYVDRKGVDQFDGFVSASYDKIYRGLYSGQLMGKHDLFNKKTTVEWMAGYNDAYRDQPDYKRYQSNGGQIIVPNTVTPTNLGRFFAAMNESSYSGTVSLKQILSITDNPLFNPEIKAGLFFENKTRAFHARNIGYIQSSTNFDYSLTMLPIYDLMNPQNINNNTGIQISEITNRKDSYNAQNNLLAYYVTGSFLIGPKVKIDAGIRFEDNLQQLTSFDDFHNVPVNVHNWVKRVLPSGGISYSLTQKMQLRAAYGQTLNRPEFRELAPFSFYDFNYNLIYHGNPDLKTAKIQHFDLRWEMYPNKGELITFGAFYKDFSNPIETYLSGNSAGGGVKDVFYMNSKSATVFGLDLEVRKSLSGLTSSGFMNNLSVLFNASLNSTSAKTVDVYLNGRAPAHPLQGAAPYSVNAGLFYNSENTGWQVNLLYNVVGKTIWLVGTDTYHDVYIKPRNVIDLTFTKRLNERFSVKGGVTDILNQSIPYYNSAVQGGPLDTNIQSYKPGQVFSLGVIARF